MTYDLEVLDEVRELDAPARCESDQALLRVLAEIVRDLHDDPWIGSEMRERFNLGVLGGCRKVPFDVPGRRGRKRFRLVYRNEPEEGAIARVLVLSAGPRLDLAAYRRAATRLGRAGRREGRSG